MNVIMIINDSMRQDHLGCYGNSWIKTPNLDNFARASAVFDYAYSECLPTVRAGAVVGGSSAGAMVLCQHFFDPYQGKLTAGLNLIPNVCVIPHHNSSGRGWAKRLRGLIHDCTLLGIDEDTGAINDGALIEGVPLLYRGDEDPAVYGQAGESSVEFLAKIHGLRKTLPAIREGSADYAAATASSGVFACLREAQGQRALVLISFNPETVASQITTNRELPGLAAAADPYV